MGIRTPVAGVRGPHDWPDYTIAATAQKYARYFYLNMSILDIPEKNGNKDILRGSRSYLEAQCGNPQLYEPNPAITIGNEWH